MPLLLLRTTKESTQSQHVLLGPTMEASGCSNFPEMVLTQNSALYIDFAGTEDFSMNLQGASFGQVKHIWVPDDGHH